MKYTVEVEGVGVIRSGRDYKGIYNEFNVARHKSNNEAVTLYGDGVAIEEYSPQGYTVDDLKAAKIKLDAMVLYWIVFVG